MRSDRDVISIMKCQVCSIWPGESCLFSIGIIIITNQVNPWPIHHHSASCRAPIGGMSYFQLSDWLTLTQPCFVNCSNTYGEVGDVYIKWSVLKEIQIYSKNIYFTKDWMECLSRNELNNNQALSLFRSSTILFQTFHKVLYIESTMIITLDHWVLVTFHNKGWVYA